MSSTGNLDLQRLMGEDILQTSTESAISELLTSFEKFRYGTNATGTGNIFKCALTLGDFEFDLDLDIFNFKHSSIDYILLEKIKYLRRLITNINNIFISLIQDLDCCTGDDRYNKTVVPIFKWLVEDSNGLCGTLLRITKEINKIYIPLKRVLCIFRNIPGNPTVGFAGADYLKYIYPMVDGLEKVMNMLDNGRFLDIIIIPVKNFHDKLMACSNGQDSDFYSGYPKIADLLSTSIYDELTLTLIDELKKTQENEDVDGDNQAPKLPTPPNLEFGKIAPKLSEFSGEDNFTEFQKALYAYNVEYSEFVKPLERQYNQDYSNYLVDLRNYRNKKFHKTLSLTEDTFESNDFTTSLMADEFKRKHRAICGCLGEIFRLDGFFTPKDIIIRNEKDLSKLIGEVKYIGVNADKYYYIENDKKKIKILNSHNLKDIRLEKLETTFEETLKFPIVENKYLEKIAKLKTVEDVITQNAAWQKEIDNLYIKYRKLSSYYDGVGDTFYEMYLYEMQEARIELSKFRAGITFDELIASDSQKKLMELSEFPPASWVTSDKSLTPRFQKTFGNISYRDYINGIEEVKQLKIEIDKINDAIGRNHTVIKVVDDSNIECGCNLLCMIIQYIIKLIMSVINTLINYIIKYISNAILNKELQWWIKFITSKVQCILDILNISKDLKEMERRFNNEMTAAKGTIRKAPESLMNCSDNNYSVLEELDMYDEKAKVSPDTIDGWEPSPYPEQPNKIDITPKFDDTFELITDKVEFISTEWKNRTIPTMLMDCTIDYSAAVNWVPKTNSWSIYLNIVPSYQQFNNSPSIILNGNVEVTEEEIIQNTYHEILFKILKTVNETEDMFFRIENHLNVFNFNTLASNFEVRDLNQERYKYGQDEYSLTDITKVWIKYDYNGTVEWIKVFDKNQEEDLKTFSKNIRENIIENLEKLKETEVPENDVPSTTTNKICDTKNVQIKLFQPLYNDDTTFLYPGPITRAEDSITGEVTFMFTPRVAETPPGSGNFVPFTRNNNPFKITLVNGSGIEFTAILLVDICVDNAIIEVSYDRDVDGVFENGRYDYINFGAISNTQQWVLKEKDIINRLRGWLESIGAVSPFMAGPLGNFNIKEDRDEVIDNTIETIKYMDGFNQEDTSSSNENINNLPEGYLKDSIYKNIELNKIFQDGINEIEKLVLEIEEVVDNNIDLGIIENPMIKQDSVLGIPLIVLNEDENIILTIQDKKLKVINISNNFNLNLVLETPEIDYKEGENLFIEFSTNGFEHKISWINERKVKAEANVLSTSMLKLKPTQIGSYYKDGFKVELFCGKFEDIIFTDSPRTPEEWFNNSNTFRPNGTIGFYDFSLFDGYHVYSVPEFFKVEKLNSLATVKGILYESKIYSREEIAIKIQEGKYNELLATEVTIIGEKPITVGGNFIWKKNNYYKNVSFGYLDNFFCRDNLKGNPFTISFWLRQKDSITNDREESTKKYIFSDTHNGNFIWVEDDLLYIKLYGQPIRTEPVKFIFKKNVSAIEPEFVEKWFHHVFRYDKSKSLVQYTIESIDQERNFDILYEPSVLFKKRINISLIPFNKKPSVLNFSLVTMLGRYDVKKLDYMDFFHGEITALAIWKEYKDDNFMKSIYDYQRKIIISED